MNNKKKIHFGWWLLIGVSLMAAFTRGGINSSGALFLTPVSQDLGIGMGSLTLYFSISSIATMLFLPIAGKMMAKYDIRLLLIVGVILQAGSFAMFGLMDSVWGWYLFAIPMAIGSVFVATMAGPVLINNWFKKHNGLAMGTMMAFVGIGGAIISPIVGNLIANNGWRSAYITLGLVVMAIVIPIIILTIRMAPQQKGLLPIGMEEVKKGASETIVEPNKGVIATVARKSTAFYALVIFFFFITAIASFGQHIPTFAMGLGYSVQFAGNALGIWMIGMLVGSIVFGFLSDKIGARNTAIFSMITGLVSIGMLLTIADNSTIFMIAIGIFGVVSASVGTLGPILTTSLFGNKEFSQIYSTAALGLALAGIVALPGYGFVFELTGTYTLVLYTIVAMLVFNIVFIILAFRGKKKLEKAGLWN
ncbi:MFS transporter [Sporosarcina sp. FSL K6-6792]|uniref:MFS transporter n=1 Tax=Sporosarcina sp. FSL K6-6792 TaxID=2921559 RepID=UPI0030F87F5D